MSTDQIKTLLEALPYIRRYHSKIVVIKMGGNAMVDDTVREIFASEISLLKLIGMKPVIVHGGGPQIDAVLEKMGKSCRYKNGMRYTDAESMSVVEMVLGGQINKSIVQVINQHGSLAVGISGKDGRLLQARRIDKDGEDEYGLVGEVVRVNTEILDILLQKNFVPVISPIGVGDDGETLNINADSVAGAIAAALSAQVLLLMTNTPGLLDADGALIERISVEEIGRMIEQETIVGGMLPKVASAIHAVNHGAGSCRIIDGSVHHALILELLTQRGVGTLIYRNSESTG